MTVPSYPEPLCRLTPEDLEARGLVRAPLRAADADWTVGRDHLFVYDVEGKQLLFDVQRVDCDAGIAMRYVIKGGRTHAFSGVYEIWARAEFFKEFEEEWKRSTS